MKILFRMLALFLIFFISSCQSTGNIDSKETQIILVRHAEKLKGKNPGLSKEGQSRAKALVGVAEKFEVRAILSSNYNRTRATAQPLATHLNLQVNTDFSPVDFNSMLKFILKNHNGQAVLVVGHSNTIPAFTSHVSAEKKYPDLDEAEFGKLFLIRFNGSKKTVEVFEQEIDSQGQLSLTPAKG